ncbi:uncharacterized protein LOC62_07G009539 [Vanrija pseudolonga]|uniref:Glycoside hydrolase 131 catalytic N-terminal domain-containing protein n=1 Tax=Vanrija pseudolonga TaxID=143232 RepID=A0AAF0YFZ0_9TREE|nr:hypothetical protein LOC62_07G009539 [Vanrija pseudolonga]
MIAPLLILYAATAASAQSVSGADPTVPPAASGAPAAASSAPAGQTPPNAYHPTRYSFTSPNVVFYPPNDWTTSQLSSFANTTGNSSVSVALAGSGASFSFSTSPALELLVNGSNAEHWNATANITQYQAAVSGLPYGWWNFTLVGNGTLTFSNAVGNTTGSRWLPALAGTPAKTSDAAALSALGVDIQTSGNWTGESWKITQTPGAELTVRPRKGTALLELNQDVPPTPFGAFNVSISPPPPYGPAEESFHPTLRGADIQAAIAQLDVLVYAVQLDPNVEYTVRVAYAGNGTDKFSVSSVGTYASSILSANNGTGEKTNGTGKPSAAGKQVYLGASVPWAVVPCLLAGLWLVV